MNTPCINPWAMTDEELRQRIQELRDMLSERSESKTFSIRIGKNESTTLTERKLRELENKIKTYKI